MKRWAALILGIVISAIALFLAFRSADFGQVLRAFQSARYEFVIAAAVAFVALTYLRGWRWSVLTQGRLTPTDGFWLFNIGFLFNNVLPARLGELARAVLAGRRPEMYFASALSSIVVERLFDMISVVILIVMVLFGMPLPDWATLAGAFMGGGALIGIGILAYAARRPHGALNVGAKLLALLPGISLERARQFLNPFVDGLGGVSNLRTFALGFGLSLLAWFLSGVLAWILMHAFWTEAPLIVGELAVAAAGLGIAVPAAPSGLGPFEAAVVGVLSAIGYNADVSRSYALALHFLNFAVTSSVGLIGLAREGVSFREIASAAREMKNVSDASQEANVEEIATRQ